MKQIERKNKMKEILKQLLKIDSKYYDSIYEYLKDVYESTKKINRKEK
tara:strand:+ start:12 stop:155 length:144 start_codon:yes stop_codon:yes gene_type:complete